MFPLLQHQDTNAIGRKYGTVMGYEKIFPLQPKTIFANKQCLRWNYQAIHPVSHRTIIAILTTPYLITL